MRRTESRPLRRCPLWALLLFCGFCGFCSLLPGWAAANEALPESLDPALFPIPETLAPNVHFWSQVYAAHSSDKVLLHDDRYLHVVYAVLDFTQLEESDIGEGRKRLIRQQEINRAKEKYRSVLFDLAAGKTSQQHAEEQARVEKLFATVPGGREKYSAAADRVRGQSCLSDRFAEGIANSGLYLPIIEEIFTRAGLPMALTRLPFVESMFQIHARSSVQAGGIWQFMPATARLYMRMLPELDERFDPLQATHAAARLLDENYAALKTWPLAITAYNHGRGGMKRAVQQLGTRDLGEIAQRYQGRSFGFASRNFYSEFVAANLVYERRAEHFPGIEPRPRLAYDEFVPDLYVALGDLTKDVADLDLEALRALNPGLSTEVWNGSLHLPQSYPLRVPVGHGATLKAIYDALPESAKSPHQVGHRYRVRSGDTLGKIAARFGTTVRALQRANGLASPNLLRVGQQLLIPGRSTAVTVASAAPAKKEAPATSAAAAKPGKHVVRAGETLSSIAQRYGTTVRALQAINKITSHIIRPSQVLLIP